MQQSSVAAQFSAESPSNLASSSCSQGDKRGLQVLLQWASPGWASVMFSAPSLTLCTDIKVPLSWYMPAVGLVIRVRASGGAVGRTSKL